MLKKRVAALDAEVKSDYVTAAKRSVLDYLLLDKEERERLGISVRPGPWEPRVVRAPVPRKTIACICLQLARLMPLSASSLEHPSPS